MTQQVSVVVIGRNEGARLVRCLASLSGAAAQIIYVDSGSEDDSVAAARAAGAEVVELDMTTGFTAARARNAGLAQAIHPLVHFIDGDCEMQPGWMGTAVAFLQAHPEVAALCGRLRERHPEASLYNRLADAEWDAEPGQVRACGGIALMRRDALDAVGGFDPTLIAGEEPELCLRLRRAGWTIWRLADEMALHDMAMTRFSQWWRRSRRGGYAFAEGAARFGAPPELHYVGETRRAWRWGIVLPALICLGALLTPWALLLLLAYPAQIARIMARGTDLTRAAFLVLGKLPEGLGVLHYKLDQLRGRRGALIEYK